MDKIVSKLFCKKDTSLFGIYQIFENASAHQLPSGIALVVNDENVLEGTITEGDIRRGIIRNNSINDINAADCMQSNPIVFPDYSAISEILELLPLELQKRNRNSSKYLGKIILINDKKQPTRVIDYHQLWEQRVASHRHIVVVGLGYVGLTMAAVMSDSGFLVTGVDVDESKLEILRKGKSYVHEVGLEELIGEQIGKNLFVSSEIPENGDVYIISVGTPVVYENGKKSPILNYLEDACNKIGAKIRRGNLIVLRSTVPIGTCRNFVKDKLEQVSGLKCGPDFQLAFAPERTAEGKALRELRSLPQIIGAFDVDSLEATAAIFRDITPTIIKVESLEAAEMAKLINNTFRDYVFAYSNQIAMIGSKFNINVVDVIKAANEGYPRDPVPLPSPGVGGPCLTKDPHIFSSVIEPFNFDINIFTGSRAINEAMHEHVYHSIIDMLHQCGKELKNVSILICGLAFKGNPETGDIRNSSAVEIAELFKGNVKNIFGYDFVTSREEIEQFGIKAVSIPEGFKGIDVVLFLNNHKQFDKINVFDMVRAMNDKPIVYDGWNMFRAEDVLASKPSCYMGLSYTKTSFDK